MEKTSTAARLSQLMAMRGIKQVDILRLCQPYCDKYNVKLQKNDLSQYVSGKVVPGQHKLTILGMGLGVSEAWLMGYDVPMERGEPESNHPQLQIEKSVPSILDMIQEQCGAAAREAFSMYLALDNDDRGEIRGEMKQMLKAEKYSAEEGLKNA